MAMSLEHSPSRARKHARPADALPDDDEVLSLAEWRALNKLSARTAARILAGPKAKRPIITQLSERRYGVTRRNNREWQARRAR